MEKIDTKEVEFFLNEIVGKVGVPYDIKTRRESMIGSIKNAEDITNNLKSKYTSRHNSIEISPTEYNDIIKAFHGLLNNIMPFLTEYNRLLEIPDLQEARRKDHWDLINEKCNNDIMYRDLWNELLLLLKLEQPNHTSEDINRKPDID